MADETIEPQQRSDDTEVGALETLATDYQQTFGTDHGRRVLTDLLGFCGLMGDESPPPRDGVEAAYCLGRSSVAGHVLTLVGTTTADILSMIEQRRAAMAVSPIPQEFVR